MPCGSTKEAMGPLLSICFWGVILWV